MADDLKRLSEEMETVFKVVKPGPFGVVEHNFSAEEIAKAKNTITSALQNWQKIAIIQKDYPTMKDYIGV